MKRSLKWIGIIISVPFALLIILSILIYIPAVQNLAVRKVASIASEATGMDISLSSVNLSFPLGIDIRRAYATQHGDTIAGARRIRLKIRPLPLLKKQVEVDALQLDDIRLNTADLTESMTLKGGMGELSLALHGVDLNRNTAVIDFLRIEDTDLDISIAEQATEDSTDSPLPDWKVLLRKADIKNAKVRVEMTADSMRVGTTVGQASVMDVTADLRRGEYSVDKLHVKDSEAWYDIGDVKAGGGIDPAHIALYGTELALCSAYYRDGTLRAELKDMRMRERCGIEILSASGRIDMGDGRIHIGDFSLRTSDSYLTLEADATPDIKREDACGQVSARLAADVGRHDLSRLLTMCPEDMKKNFPSVPLQIRAGLDGRMDSIRLTHASAEMAGHVKLAAEGYAIPAADGAEWRAHVYAEAEFPDMGFVGPLPGGTTIPAGTTTSLTADMEGGRARAHVMLKQDSGTIVLNGEYKLENEEYFAETEIRDMNADSFMPDVPLHKVSAKARIKGRGLDLLNPECRMRAYAGITHLEYNQMNLPEITLTAGLRNGKMRTNLDVRDSLTAISSALNADISMESISADMTTEVRKLDLHTFGLSPKPLGTTGIVILRARTDLGRKHEAEMKIHGVRLTAQEKAFPAKDLEAKVRMTEDSLTGLMKSGDMMMALRTVGGTETVTEKILQTIRLAESQWKDRKLSPEDLRHVLPEISFNLAAGDDNPLANVLGTAGTGFEKLAVAVSTSKAEGISAGTYLYGLHTDSIRIDTISLVAAQDSAGIMLKGTLKTGSYGLMDAFGITVNGGIDGKGARLTAEYDNERGETGALIGLEAVLEEEGTTLHVIPENPTIAYRKFRLNRGNRIFIGDDGKILADVRLADDKGTGLHIYSAQNAETLQDITLSLNRLDIGELRRIIPYMPDVEGIMTADVRYIQHEREKFAAVLDTSVGELTYCGTPLGDWNVSGAYLPGDNGEHYIDCSVTHNGAAIADMSGRYMAAEDEGGQDSVEAGVEIRHFPLRLANAFVPEGTASLSGYVDADVRMSGPTDSPVINGSMQPDSLHISVPMTSMNLRLDDKPVTVTDNKLVFDKYSIYSRGPNPYVIDGSISFADMENLSMDLRMTARNFEVFNSKKNRTSMVYGKMYIDLDTYVRGTPNAISVRGNANISGASNFTYILRESPLTVEDRLGETVKFVNFADTTTHEKPTEHTHPTWVDMLINLHIDQAVQCKVDINESGSNYMRVEGGGDLSFQYTPDGNMLLNGQYLLISGEMKYEMPVIPLKTFRIREGSYIEWTGNVMDPRLNIMAYERTRASVTQEGQAARMVGFDVGVSITDRLSNLGLAFTLEAPEDGSMQNELAAMSASQKNKAAVTMLVTGMYISDSQTAKLDASSALNSYLQGQINNIAGNALKTIDLSLGMETTNTTETGEQRTDYNFQFARRFWNNRVRVVIGGTISTGDAAARDESFIDNISLEYRLDNSGTRYVRLFHDRKYANVLEGEVMETGVGIVLKKKVTRIRDLFLFRRKKSKRNL